MRILIVDDEADVLDAFETLLSDHGHTVFRARCGHEALQILRTGAAQMVLCDQLMPGMSGDEVCRTLRSESLSNYIYFITISGQGTQDDRVAALAAGADDFIAKPVDPRELLERVQVAVRLTCMTAHDVTVFALAKLAESRDPDTGAHLERVQHYCRVLANDLGKLEQYRAVIDEQFITLLFQTSPLHDIGKVGIPDHVLLKPGKLTEEEFEIMKGHTAIGEQTLQAALDKFPGAMFLRMARDIAGSHHERFDGTGYPRGLAGEKIPLAARIVAVADVYDALTSKRVYKQAISHTQAKAIIVAGSGTQFDSVVVNAFERQSSEFLKISQRYRDVASLAA